MRAARCATAWLACFTSVVSLVGVASANEPLSQRARAGSRTDGPAAASVDSVTAARLFLEGRALLEQGQPRAACELLERSKRLTTTLGVLLNLGLCHRFSGRLATAHDYYRQAEIMATLENDQQRLEVAHEEAAALSAQRATLTLRISGSPDTPLEVWVDDVSLAREEWEKPRYMDAGDHRISVRSNSHESWQGTMIIVDGKQHVFVIPEFWTKAAGAPPAPEATAPADVARAATAELVRVPSTRTQAAEPSTLGTGSILGLAIAGAGLAALGVSAAYSISAKNDFDQSSGSCRNDICDAEGRRLRDDAFDDATRATVLGISGGVALAGGLALWLLSDAPSKPELSVFAGRGVLAASVTGAL
jgi:hypothetical protein